MQVDRIRFDLAIGDVPVANGTSVFPVDDGLFRARKISFGIAPARGALPSVRVRLYRTDRALGADLPAGIVIDQTIDLPAPDDGVVTVNAFLSADTFGIPGRLTAQPGKPAPSRVGTWHGGRRLGCATAPGVDEACVPGGSYFFGDPAFRGRTFDNDVFDERPVWISPFFLDAHEVTVAALRAAKLTGVPAAQPRTDGDLDEEAGIARRRRPPARARASP